MINRHVVIAVFVAMSALACNELVTARERADEPVILVATPELHDRLYGASVLIAAPIGGGQHIGLILNHPTRSKLSEMFPDHEPSRKVTEPIFLGGPESTQALFALVQRQGHSNASKLKLATNLYLEVERERVDGVIENEHGHARFYAGLVVWRPGELEAEIEEEYWYVQEADPELVMRKSTSGMWEELVKRVRQNRNAITAGAPMVPGPQAMQTLRIVRE